MILKHLTGKLGEGGQQGEDGGEYMHVEGYFPPGIAYVGLFETQESDVIPEGGIVQEDPEHQIGGDA